MHLVLRRAALVGAGLLVGCGLAEVLVHLTAPLPAEELLFGAPLASPRDLFAPDAELHSLPTVGFTGEIAGLGYRVPIRINSVGLRGPEPGGGRSWVAIGDSFTMAVQVPEEEHFATLLGEKLGIEVLNAGVDGYSTWQAVGRYRRLTVDVEAALLGFFLGNDIQDNLGPRKPAAVPRPPDGGPPPATAAQPPEPTGAMRWLFTHSHAFAWVRVARRSHGSTASPDAARFREELAIFTEGGARQLARALPKTEAALRGLKEATRARGDGLLVALLPPAFAVDARRAETTLRTFGLTGPDVDAPRRALLDLTRRLDIATCDLTDALRAGGSAMYLRFDGHLSADRKSVV